MRAPAKTIANARRLRRSLSPPEARLWGLQRPRAPEMPVFRHQHPIGPYVLDFYCAKARLAVEIDGISHDVADRPEHDARRDAWLRGKGITVMRVPAADAAQRIGDRRRDCSAGDRNGRSPLHRATARRKTGVLTDSYGAVPLPRFAWEDKRPRASGREVLGDPPGR